LGKVCNWTFYLSGLKRKERKGILEGNHSGEASSTSTELRGKKTRLKLCSLKNYGNYPTGNLDAEGGQYMDLKKNQMWSKKGVTSLRAQGLCLFVGRKVGGLRRKRGRSPPVGEETDSALDTNRKDQERQGANGGCGESAEPPRLVTFKKKTHAEGEKPRLRLLGFTSNWELAGKKKKTMQA